jgi:hypothetical protein
MKLVFLRKKGAGADVQKMSYADQEVRGRGSKAALHLRQISRGGVRPHGDGTEGQTRFGPKPIQLLPDSDANDLLHAQQLPLFRLRGRLLERNAAGGHSLAKPFKGEMTQYLAESSLCNGVTRERPARKVIHNLSSDSLNFKFRRDSVNKTNALHATSPTRRATFSYQTGGSVPTKRAGFSYKTGGTPRRPGYQWLTGMCLLPNGRTWTTDPLDVSYQTGEGLLLLLAYP